MKNRFFVAVSMLVLTLFIASGIVLSGCTIAQSSSKTAFIAGSYGALSRGVYDGEMTIGDLKNHGDFALGTFSGIDGELLALDGTYYRIGAQGEISPADDAWTTPYAIATSLNIDKVINIDKALDYQQLQQYLDSQLPTPNIFYAMKISGNFNYIKARSLTKLTKPYPATPYSTITQDEPTFEFRNVDSTLAVFWGPAYTGDISYPGYHIHFINSDKTHGGHLLDCQMTSARVEIEYIPNFTVSLPQNSTFYKADFNKAR